MYSYGLTGTHKSQQSGNEWACPARGLLTALLNLGAGGATSYLTLTHFSVGLCETCDFIVAVLADPGSERQADVARHVIILICDPRFLIDGNLLTCRAVSARP